MLKRIYKEAKLFLEIYHSTLPSEQVAVLLLGKGYYTKFKHLYDILQVDIFEESHSPNIDLATEIKNQVIECLEEYQQLSLLEDDEDEDGDFQED